MENKDDHRFTEQDDVVAPDAAAEEAENKLPEIGDKYPLSGEAAPDDMDDSLGADMRVQQLGDGDRIMDTRDPAEKEPGKFKRFFIGYWRRRRWTLALTVLFFIGVLFVVPATRYPLLALGFTQTYEVKVTDSKTATPVSGAKVMLDGQTAMTNSTGYAVVKAKVGKRSATVSKQYYTSATVNVFVGVSAGKNVSDIHLNATGRQVPIKVVNKVTGAPISNAEIAVLNTDAKTDDSGTATIVLPTGAPTRSVTVSASGYNNLSAKVSVVSNVSSANTFALTPSGRVYFLSNLSGNIDVVSTNLDGHDRKTVVAGTGTEDPNTTVLLASNDWQYLSLLSKRDNGQNGKLYLINTSNNQLTTIDGGSTDYINPVGWSDHSFVYTLVDNGVLTGGNGQTYLKSYDADSGKTTTIDQTSAGQSQVGTQTSNVAQAISFVNIVNTKVVYGLTWSSNPATVSTNNDNEILSANIDGSDKTNLKTISIPLNTYSTYMSALEAKPGSLQIQSSVGAQLPNVYFVYNDKNNSVTQTNTISDSTYAQEAQDKITYLASPSGNQTFWAEQRDGKSTLFVGDADGNNSNQIASLSDYTTYAWYSDKYILVEKGGSELYIMPAGGGQALKISDYYKPPRNYYGYGGL
jgi:hypothetical protein